MAIQMAVEVIPLRYAWAEDQSFVFSGQQVIVPGVATILRSIVSGQANAVGTQIGPLPVNNLAGLAGQGLKRRQNLAIAQAQQIARDAQVAAAQSRGQVDAFQQLQSQFQQRAEEDGGINPLDIPMQGVVQADSRLNAIVIRDARARINYFKEVIKELDQPSGLVHLEVNIVDVNANAGYDFGPPYLVQWQRNGTLRSADFQIGNTVAASTAQTALTSNLQFRLLDGAVTQVLAQFEALESDGRARIVSRPSVLTINNVEAHLEATSTFFVPVQSEEDADLFDVTVGTTLRIVPHIVCEQTGRRVKLIVRVEDGTQTPDSVSGIPVITRNTLNTQAVLNEGESLLLAGLFREEVSKVENRVPILGRTPVLGHLFTSTTSLKQKFDRVVLIRPRIIDLPPPGIHADSGLEPVEGFGLGGGSACDVCNPMLLGLPGEMQDVEVIHPSTVPQRLPPLSPAAGGPSEAGEALPTP
ncbi:MAG: secretin N-terminal domain-containing protein, partial [Planctomycetota bacterium]